MKKFLSILGIIILVAVIVSMTILLVLKIKNDTIAKRDEDIMAQNEKAESEYICKNANEKLQEIIANIKKDVDKEIELANTGSINKMDLCFVVKDNEEYRYIIREEENGEDKFAVAKDNLQVARYIISPITIGIDNCIYTNIDNYIIDSDFNITYLMTN